MSALRRHIYATAAGFPSGISPPIYCRGATCLATGSCFYAIDSLWVMSVAAVNFHEALSLLQRQRNRRHAVLADDKDLVDLVGEVLEDQSSLRHGCISGILS